MLHAVIASMPCCTSTAASHTASSYASMQSRVWSPGLIRRCVFADMPIDVDVLAQSGLNLSMLPPPLNGTINAWGYPAECPNVGSEYCMEPQPGGTFYEHYACGTSAHGRACPNATLMVCSRVGPDGEFFPNPPEYVAHAHSHAHALSCEIRSHREDAARCCAARRQC